jgi:hypothetical protein
MDEAQDISDLPVFLVTYTTFLETCTHVLGASCYIVQ